MNAVLVLRFVPHSFAALPGLAFGVALAVTLQGRQKETFVRRAMELSDSNHGLLDANLPHGGRLRSSKQVGAMERVGQCQAQVGLVAALWCCTASTASELAIRRLEVTQIGKDRALEDSYVHGCGGKRRVSQDSTSELGDQCVLCCCRNGSRPRKEAVMFPVSVGVLEILVAGVTASSWFGLLVAILAGWSHPPKWLGGGATVLLIYATLAYGLGVVVDAAADTVFTRMLKRAWPQAWSPKKPPKNRIAARAAHFVDPIATPLAEFVLGAQTKHPEYEPITQDVFLRLREAALLRDDGLAKFMEYQRSRMRIARAMMLNLLLLLPIGIWFFTSSLHVSAGLITGFVIVVLIGIVVSGRVAERLRLAYDSHLRQLPILESAAPLGRIRAAAVCVRAASTGKEYLLIVRTKEPELSSERWTFPKGHVEAGESLVEAAMREAREEAGAEGIVHSDPLPPYLFPAGASNDALVVIPFLMETIEHTEPTEPGRTMYWFSPDEAKKHLRLNREDPFTNEHDRVIDRAIELFRLRVRHTDPPCGTDAGGLSARL